MGINLLFSFVLATIGIGIRVKGNNTHEIIRNVYFRSLVNRTIN